MKKFLLLISALFLSLVLAACGSDSSSSDNSSNDNNGTKIETKNDTNKEEKEKKDEKEVTKSELGTLTVVNKKKDLNQTVKSGPMNLTIEAIQTANLDVAESYKETFEGKEKVTVITVQMKAENTSDETINFYPDQATLTTNNGDQVEADLLFSDHIGGEFFGKVHKDGNVIFFVDSPAEEIKNIKLIIDGASDSNYDSLSKQLTIELAF